MQISSRIIFIILHVISPLLAGSLIYIFLRLEPTIAFSTVNQYLRLPNPIIYQSTFVTRLTGSFPDFCWLYALLSFQIGIIWGSYSIMPKSLLFFMYISTIGTELLQYLHVIRGTGDMFDVVAYVSAISIHYVIHKNNKYGT